VSERPFALPITSRGIELTDRACWAILGTAMALSAGLILSLNRGATFNLDEVDFLEASPGLGPGDVLDPHNGHLVATTRLAYKAILETVGAEYLAFRVLGVLAVLLAAALFFALAKRRIGAVPALAPSLVLLFFGSAWAHVLVPIGFTDIFSICAGLGAILALERGDRRGDAAACALLVLSVATFSVGLAFVVGVAISVIARPDRRRRAWIFLVPLALYAAWWLWAASEPSFSGQQAKASNVLLIPNYVAESLAVVATALAGLNYEFELGAARFDFGAGGPGWGPVLALLAVVALALRVRRGSLPASLWASLGIVLTYWTLGALVTGEVFGRGPDSVRYVYTGAIGVLLVATDAARSIRFSTLGIAALFAAAAFSLATNIALLRDAAAHFRNDYAAPARAQFAMLELARDTVDPAFDPAAAVPPDVSPVSSPAGTYFEVVDRYGSPAFSLRELERQSESVRQDADRILASAHGVGLAPGRSRPTGECRRLAGDPPGGAVGFELPPGGARLRVQSASPAPVTLGRFATVPSIELGTLSPGETATLAIPPDASSRPWRASVAGTRSVTVCPG
jgi:hypothetical protein